MEGEVFGARSSGAGYQWCKFCRFVVVHLFDGAGRSLWRLKGVTMIERSSMYSIHSHLLIFLILGFYYVCVDFNPQPTTSAVRPLAQSMTSTPETEECVLPPISSHSKLEMPQARTRRDSSTKRVGRAPSTGPRTVTPVPKMTGFYFHQNSEPYVSFAVEHGIIR